MIIIVYINDNYREQKLSVTYLEINVFFSGNQCVFVRINKVQANMSTAVIAGLTRNLLLEAILIF
jgi:hypothetical protein